MRWLGKDSTRTIEWTSYVPTKPLSAAGVASVWSWPKEDIHFNPVKSVEPESDADATSASDATAAPPATAHRARYVRRGSPRSGSDSAPKVDAAEERACISLDADATETRSSRIARDVL